MHTFTPAQIKELYKLQQEAESRNLFMECEAIDELMQNNYDQVTLDNLEFCEDIYDKVMGMMKTPL